MYVTRWVGGDKETLCHNVPKLLFICQTPHLVEEGRIIIHHFFQMKNNGRERSNYKLYLHHLDSESHYDLQEHKNIAYAKAIKLTCMQLSLAEGNHITS